MDDSTTARAQKAQITGNTDGTEVVTVRPGAPLASKQGLPIFQGVSAENAGATRVCMHRVEIPPGAAAEPHLHEGHETAIFLLQGRVETRYGEGLARSQINEAGDFLFIPAGLPHQPVNLSQTEPAIAIVARTDPSEQESVRPYPG